MSAGKFSFSYKLCTLGLLGESDAKVLSLVDITNYSLEGSIHIALDVDEMVLSQVPLLEAFFAFRQMLKIVPVFAKKVSYAQMFREARTMLSVEGGELIIEHSEIRALRAASGVPRLQGNYVKFASEYGRAARNFLTELKTRTPSLFEDRRILEKYSDLFVCLEFEDGDLSSYPIV